jgi:hypothetical protein
MKQSVNVSEIGALDKTANSIYSTKTAKTTFRDSEIFRRSSDDRKMLTDRQVSVTTPSLNPLVKLFRKSQNFNRLT